MESLQEYQAKCLLTILLLETGKVVLKWPVYLKYDGGSWNSTTNAWREWSWNGN